MRLGGVLTGAASIPAKPEFGLKWSRKARIWTNISATNTTSRNRTQIVEILSRPGPARVSRLGKYALGPPCQLVQVELVLVQI